MENRLEKATFGAGCFWGVEEAFYNIKGVKSTTVGYTGGEKENPTYKEVCLGSTGHTEAVQIEYDPSEVSYNELLSVFWKIHNSAQRNKRQYRSVIFYHTKEQKELALKMKQGLTKESSVYTDIEPPATFYKAEDYHQKYFLKGKTCG